MNMNETNTPCMQDVASMPIKLEMNGIFLRFGMEAHGTAF